VGLRILACGSRDVDPLEAWDWWRYRLEPAAPLEPIVISGGARGADAIAHRVAKSLGYRTETYPANWKEHGRKAGILRNLRMLDEGKPDIVIAFWDGKSRGTHHTIVEAERRGIRTEIHRTGRGSA
jgi:hypothetical protein